MDLTLRLATEDDGQGIQAIYAPIVEDTTTSFEYEVPTVQEMQRRIRYTLEKFPYLVCDDGGTVAGYAYASLLRSRKAYQWSVEASVYIHQDYHKRGIGRALYTALFAVLKGQGFFTVFTGITQPNPASIGFHEAMGFEPVGVYKNIGFKQGDWHDVAWYGMALQPYIDNPSDPIALPDMPMATIEQILSDVAI